MQKIEAALKPSWCLELTLNIGMTRTLILCSLTFYMDVIMRFMKTEIWRCASAFQYYRTYRQDGAGSIKNDKKIKAPQCTQH